MNKQTKEHTTMGVTDLGIKETENFKVRQSRILNVFRELDDCASEYYLGIKWLTSKLPITPVANIHDTFIAAKNTFFWFLAEHLDMSTSDFILRYSDCVGDAITHVSDSNLETFLDRWFIGFIKPMNILIDHILDTKVDRYGNLYLFYGACNLIRSIQELAIDIAAQTLAERYRRTRFRDDISQIIPETQYDFEDLLCKAQVAVSQLQSRTRLKGSKLLSESKYKYYKSL